MQYCSNCMETILTEPLEGEIERTICPNEIEMDVPVIIYFCSEECKEEFFAKEPPEHEVHEEPDTDDYKEKLIMKHGINADPYSL